MNKMSACDKIKKWEKYFENFNLDDNKSLKQFVKESLKVRQKTLRKLLTCYLGIFDCFVTGMKNIPYTPEHIQETLKCGKREAYDYWRTMHLISQLDKLIETQVYKAMVEVAEFEKEKLKVSGDDNKNE